ncbi:MAG: hypothetical protein LBQ94_10415 [Treponema sp.]|jgi:hypothetical protein|nr:hypothetical protein [Treponema sp.]
MEQEPPEEERTYSLNQIKKMGTHTLLELYRNEISQKTKEELQGNALFKAIEHEIEKRLREYDKIDTPPRPKLDDPDTLLD